MHRSIAAFLVSVTVLLGGCASQPKAAPASACDVPAPPAAPSSDTPAIATAPSTAAAPAITAEELQGFWAEYWARQGQAETQRYVFLADGRFGWLAPQRDVPAQDPLQRSGHYSIEGNVLVLQVARERFSGCGGGCKHAGEDRVVEHAAPMRISLEVGECPPNDEASKLDPGYKCRSIGGRAFWRRPAPDAQDAEPFFH